MASNQHLFVIKQTDKTNIIDYIKVGNIDVYDSKKIADEMGHFFSTIGSKYANNIAKSQTSINDYLRVIPRNTKNIFFTPTSSVEVMSLISKLPDKKVVDLTINN